MSRSDYSDDCYGWELICYRGAVKSAIRGKRGQALLNELVEALDALPEKSLSAESLVSRDGEYCALGALGRMRGMIMEPTDPDDVDASEVAKMFGVATALAAEIMFENDEVISENRWVKVETFGPLPRHGMRERTVKVADPLAGERRWLHMREWAMSNLFPAAAANAAQKCS